MPSSQCRRISLIASVEQEVIVDEPAEGEFFGFASMIEQTPHHTTAIVLEESSCIEVSRDDIATLLQHKPHAGMDLLTTLARQFHAAQALIQTCVTRNPNELIEAEATTGERVADHVARFGGSWTFIIAFGVVSQRPQLLNYVEALILYCYQLIIWLEKA